MKDLIPRFIGEKKWDKSPRTRKFVVSGCGRSGTLYMAKVLNILGFEVGHEGVHRNGTSSWYLTEPSHANYIKAQFYEHNVTYIHIVRNPLNVITSMWHCEHMKSRFALDFVREYLPQWELGYDLEAVVKWWVLWNMGTSTNFPIDITLPIEQLQLPDAVYSFCEKARIKYTPKKFQKIVALGEKTHTHRRLLLDSLKKDYGEDFLKTLTIEDIANECGEELTGVLKDFAKNYGYTL